VVFRGPVRCAAVTPNVGLLRGIQAVGGLGAGLLIAAVANRVTRGAE